MIMSYSYLVDLGDKEFEALATDIRAFTVKLVRLHPMLRGLRLQQQDSKMRIILRIAGLTRWAVGREAPKLLSILLRKYRLTESSATFESMIMEPGRSHLRDGQGRTEMTRRPRAERMADGRPWDHIAWEGDDINFSDQSQSGRSA